MKRTPGAVGVAGDVPALLRGSGRDDVAPAHAVDRGWLWREKVEGVWVYATGSDAFARAESFVAAATEKTLNEWLVGPLHPLSGYVAKSSRTPVVTKNATRQFVRQLLRHERLGAIAALTNEYEPYLSAVALDDRAEVENQVSFVAAELDAHGRLTGGDLPMPLQHRTLRAWRDVILRHCEYLGLGRMDAGELVAWPSSTR